MRRGARALLTALVLAVPAPGGAQGHGPLDGVEALMDQGRIEAAREALLAWWDDALPSASRNDRQRSLWLRGLLTVDPSMAEADFHRLALEYPGGPFTDGALYRLALWADTRGDPGAAVAHMERLLRDHPGSPLRSLAEARLASELRPAPPLLPAYPSAGGVDPVATGESPSRGDRALSFAAQVGAFQDPDRAEAVARELRHQGFQPRVVRVPGSDLVRVRVGRFGLRDEAVAMMLELRGRGFEATLATDASSEEEIG